MVLDVSPGGLVKDHEIGRRALGLVGRRIGIEYVDQQISIFEAHHLGSAAQESRAA